MRTSANLPLVTCRFGLQMALQTLKRSNQLRLQQIGHVTKLTSRLYELCTKALTLMMSDRYFTDTAQACPEPPGLLMQA
jgi:hypothetical protein